MIAKCIEGAIRALKNIKDWEIILVDSYSTDKTIEIAKQFPIKILRLKKEWFKSPHAGRYIGTINSSGKYVFFLDADMIVKEGWIEAALDILDKYENLAGVTGVMYNIWPKEGLNENHRMKGSTGYVDFLPGPSVYKKSILIEAKHFNPHLKGNGEREIGFRISKLGYRQLRIDKTICYHCKKDYNLDEAIEKAGYFVGVGQFLRLHFNKRNLIETLVRYKMVFIHFAILIALFLLFSVALLMGSLNIFLKPLIVLLSLLLLFLIIFKKSPRRTIISLNGLTVASLNFIYGFFKAKKEIKDYPIDAEVVK